MRNGAKPFRETGAEKHDQILRELNEERAAALQRISSTLDSLIAQLGALGASLKEGREGLPADGARMTQSHGVDRPRQIAAYQELRRQALRYRWYLEVQREALGLRHHHRLDEFYPIPAALEP